MSRSNDIAGLTTSILDGVTAAEVGLGNVTNESKATMFASPTFTGTVSGVDAGHLTTGTLGNTVQDNITRLGVVTTGTMKNTIHSDATFPAGHIIQSVLSPTISNIDQTSTSSELGIMEANGQITLSSSSNGVLVFFSAKIATHPSTSSYGKAFIRKGTISSFGTILCSQHFGANISSSTDHPLALWGFDASPGSTTPQYVLTIEKNASSTSSVQLAQNTDITRCYLFEVKQ